jgi:hypothetical protein
MIFILFSFVVLITEKKSYAEGFKVKQLSRSQWCMPVIPAVGRVTRED